MKRILMGAAAAVALLAASANFASAAPIIGNINFFGEFQPTINGTATQNMALANGIDFLPIGGGSGSLQTLSANGDLAAFANLSGGSIADFSFDPFSAIANFYTISNGGGGTLSFSLTGLSALLQNESFLNLKGTGTISATGYDPTPGTFNFTGQSSDGASQTATFSWSAGSAAKPDAVPEPATLSLMGLGLLAAGMFRRRQKKA